MASISFEIEVALDGSVDPYEPPTRDDPGCDAEVVDLEVTDIGLITIDRDVSNTLLTGRMRFKTTSLLAGVNTQSPDIQKLFANIIEAQRCEACDAIFDASEDTFRRGKAA